MPLTAPAPITELLGNAVQILGCAAVPSSLGIVQDVLEAGDPVARLVRGQGGLLVIVLVASRAPLHHGDLAVGALEQLLDVLWGHPVLVLFTAPGACCLDCGQGDVSIIHKVATLRSNPAETTGERSARAKTQGLGTHVGAVGAGDICGYFVGLFWFPGATKYGQSCEKPGTDENLPCL